MPTDITFEILSQEAKRSCEAAVSAREFEPAFVKVLKQVKHHQENRGTYKQYFVSMLSDPNLGPWELIAFCMRDLQWPEVLDKAKQQLSVVSDFRIKNVMAKIAEVYEPDWPDSDIYAYYSESHN